MVAEAQRLRALSASHVLMALQSITHPERNSSAIHNAYGCMPVTYERQRR